MNQREKMFSVIAYYTGAGDCLSHESNIPRQMVVVNQMNSIKRIFDVLGFTDTEDIFKEFVDFYKKEFDEVSKEAIKDSLEGK